jgi:hypothetical protein
VLPFRTDGWMHRRIWEERRHVVDGKERAVRLERLADTSLMAELAAGFDVEIIVNEHTPLDSPCGSIGAAKLEVSLHRRARWPCGIGQ